MKILDDIKAINKKPPSEKPIGSAPKKVLVVEDEASLSELLKEKLKRAGFSVFTAGNGQEGLEEAKTHKPDAIILDLLMPVMDGKAMLSKMRQIPDLKYTPVVILTNAGEVDNIKETLEYFDAVEFLIKSNIDLDQIVEKIKGHTLGTRLGP